MTDLLRDVVSDWPGVWAFPDLAALAGSDADGWGVEAALRGLLHGLATPRAPAEAVRALCARGEFAAVERGLAGR